MEEFLRRERVVVDNLTRWGRLRGMTVSEILKAVRNVPGLADVIEGTRGSAIGTVVRAEEAALAGLRLAGVIGENGGLTVKGSAVAKILQEEYLDRMFG